MHVIRVDYQVKPLVQGLPWSHGSYMNHKKSYSRPSWSRLALPSSTQLQTDPKGRGINQTTTTSNKPWPKINHNQESHHQNPRHQSYSRSKNQKLHKCPRKTQAESMELSVHLDPKEKHQTRIPNSI